MSALELKFLGEFKVIRDGRPMALPPSRKTRALLAYLCLSARRCRREHLCGLLWEIPDDPRGSLRWSLSKLRRLLDDDDRPRVVADRACVGIDAGDIAIDVAELRALVDTGLRDATLATLEDAAARFPGTFLEGLEFSNFHHFHAWCIAEREQSARAQAAVLRELVNRLEGSPGEALPYARALVGIAPYDEPSRAALIRLLIASRRVDEAHQQYQLGMRMLKEAGITSTGALLLARRGAAEPSPSPAPPAPRPPPPTAATMATHPLIGRDDEIHRLADVLSRVQRTARAAVVLLRGEPGIGKSRMLECATHQARESGAVVLEASAYESETMRPFALWIDALRGMQARGEEQVFGGQGVENRDRLFEALGSFVSNRAAAHLVVLVFDDVQWCDESSAAALHYVLRMNRERPLLAVLAARDGELQDNVPLQQALRGVRRHGMLHECELGPLPAAAIAALIAEHAPGADRERLSRECGGNPLLAIELARAEQEGAGRGSLEQLVRERLARFGVDGAEVLHWTAVLSPRIDVATLQRVTEQSADEVAAALEHAERQGILSSGGGGLRFSHELVARAVYTGISPVRRRNMHRRIAEQMEADTTLDLARASDLAHHATQSGDPALAAKAMVSAGRLCLRFFANDEALSLARKGLQHTEQLPAAERVCLSIDLHGILQAAAPLEDWDEAARHYVALAEQALDHGALAHAGRAYDMAAYVRWEHGQWDGAREQSLQAERVTRSGSDKDQIVGMAVTAKCLALLERDLPHADAMLMAAESLASRKRIRHHAIPAGIGLLRFYENRMDEAEERLKEARTLCKSAGDRINEYQANEYLVMIDIQRGLFADAKSRCDELRAIGSKLRAGSEGPFACALHGLCVYALDDEAAPLDAALVELRIADAKHRLAYVLTRAALLDYERGRLDAALCRADEALAYAALLELRTETMLAHAVLGLAHQAAGRPGKARAHFAEVTGLEAAGVAEWARGTAARLGIPEQLQITRSLPR